MGCSSSLSEKARWFDKWYAAEKADPSWIEPLPPAPCKLEFDGHKWLNPDPVVWDNPHRPFQGQKYHPGAVTEIRTVKTRAGSRGQGEQCTYDANGNLITHGPGAGTADRYSPNFWVGFLGGGHLEADVKPFDYALDLDRNGWNGGGYVQKYIEVRPNDNKNNAPQNP
jgi:hypothetical protein